MAGRIPYIDEAYFSLVSATFQHIDFPERLWLADGSHCPEQPSANFYATGRNRDRTVDCDGSARG